MLTYTLTSRLFNCKRERRHGGLVALVLWCSYEGRGIEIRPWRLHLDGGEVLGLLRAMPDVGAR